MIYLILLKGRKISDGHGEGVVIKSSNPITFYRGIDEKTGKIIDKDSDKYGESISDKIFVFPMHRGSTVGTYVLLGLKHYRKEPKAIITSKAEIIVSAGAILCGIPMIDSIDINKINDKDYVFVDGNKGYVKILRRNLNGR